MSKTFKRLRVLSIIFIVNSLIGYAQINENALFLVSEKSDSIYVSEKSSVKIRYKYKNIEQNWWLQLDHINILNDNRNHYKLEIPEEMFQEFMKKGNVTPIQNFIKIFESLDFNEAYREFNNRYPPYYYKINDGKTNEKQRRYNVFLILDSNLDKKYIECYEVSILFGNIIVE